MTRRRWMADEVHGNTAALTGEHAAHLSRVLRTEVGQEFDIATGDAVRRGTVTAVSSDRVEFTLGEELSVIAAAPVTLALAIFKFDRMEWAIEKCTEIGVARIVPVIAGRTDSHLAAAALKRHERWRRIARQAAEQSRRTALPEIAAPVRLKDLETCGPRRQSDAASLRVVLNESERNSRLRDVLQGAAGAVTIAVGPEGGWTEDELQWFANAGWASVSVGETILRAETAAIVAAALALDAVR